MSLVARLAFVMFALITSQSLPAGNHDGGEAPRAAGCPEDAMVARSKSYFGKPFEGFGMHIRGTAAKLAYEHSLTDVKEEVLTKPKEVILNRPRAVYGTLKAGKQMFCRKLGEGNSAEYSCSLYFDKEGAVQEDAVDIGTRCGMKVR